MRTKSNTRVVDIAMEDSSTIFGITNTAKSLLKFVPTITKVEEKEERGQVVTKTTFWRKKTLLTGDQVWYCCC